MQYINQVTDPNKVHIGNIKARENEFPVYIPSSSEMDITPILTEGDKSAVINGNDIFTPPQEEPDIKITLTEGTNIANLNNIPLFAHSSSFKITKVFHAAATRTSQQIATEELLSIEEFDLLYFLITGVYGNTYTGFADLRPFVIPRNAFKRVYQNTKYWDYFTFRGINDASNSITIAPVMENNKFISVSWTLTHYTAIQPWKIYTIKF